MDRNPIRLAATAFKRVGFFTRRVYLVVAAIDIFPPSLEILGVAHLAHGFSGPLCGVIPAPGFTAFLYGIFTWRQCLVGSTTRHSRGGMVVENRNFSRSYLDHHRLGVGARNLDIINCQA